MGFQLRKPGFCFSWLYRLIMGDGGGLVGSGGGV